MLTKKHNSIRRNRSLASIFFAAGYVENWGQGIEKVIKQCHANGNPEPVFSERYGGLSSVLKVNPMKDVDDIPQKMDSLDAKDKALINCIIDNDCAAMAEMSAITGIPVRTVSRRLKSMMESNIISREGSTKVGKWVIVE